MEEFLNNNPSLKRLGVTVAGSAAIALNKKFGLGLDATDIMTLGGIVVTYLAQSAVVQKAKLAGEQAAAAVDSPAKAADILGGKVVP
jgi:hypothetical protein